MLFTLPNKEEQDAKNVHCKRAIILIVLFGIDVKNGKFLSGKIILTELIESGTNGTHFLIF